MPNLIVCDHLLFLGDFTLCAGDCHIGDRNGSKS
jgi:hypothetical protein